MSLLKSNSVQIGQSATATQNFTLSVPSSPDGTIKLARGNSGATTADVLTVDASGNVTTTLAGGSVKFSQLSTSATEADNVASRTAKAWVNFNGAFASSPFTIANGGIRASFNVSSVTDNGTGDYTVNFATALADASYAVAVVGSKPNNEAYTQLKGLNGSFGTSNFSIDARGTVNTTSNYDPEVVTAIVFR